MPGSKRSSKDSTECEEIPNETVDQSMSYVEEMDLTTEDHRNEYSGENPHQVYDSNNASTLHEAAKLDQPDICTSLLGQGAQIDENNEYGYTALHVCAYYNSTNVCKMLIENGADVNARNKYNNTPLHVAARHNTPEVCGILLDNQSFIDAKGINDCTPLHLAVQNNFMEMCAKLLEHGANVNAVRKHNRTPLHDAVSKCDGDQLSKMLIKYGADVHAADRNGKTPLHICCAVMIENEEAIKSGSYRETLKTLVNSGADPKRDNFQGISVFKMTEQFPDLNKLIKYFIRYPLIQKWEKRNDRTRTYENLLYEVIRGENIKKVSFYEFNKNQIGVGAYGTVYAGINAKDGREVAVKKIESRKLQNSEREIKHLMMLRGCPYIVNYLDYKRGKYSVYIIIELMEGTLQSLVHKPSICNCLDVTQLCQDIVNALQFLHNKKIVHRDIKPTNILYTSSPRIMLKIADFGLSKQLESDSSTVGYSGAGTRHWMAPEVHRSLDQFSPASDVFASGLVLYYLMTSNHPFAPTDVTCTREKRLFVEHKTVENILNHNMSVDSSLSPEAVHFIHQMLKDDKEQRPSADEMLAHPFFWSNQKKLKFLEATANQPEIFQRGVNDFKKDLELTQLGAQFQRVPWSEQSPTMIYIYDEMMVAGRRKYNTTSVAELLRFMRNAFQHVSEPGRTSLFREYLLKDFVFLKEFKPLSIDVYETVLEHEWDKNKEEIMYAMS